MALQKVNVGSAPDDPGAESIRSAFEKMNANVDETEARLLDGGSDLGSSTDAEKGAGMVGFQPEVEYPANTVGAELRDIRSDLASTGEGQKGAGAVGFDEGVDYPSPSVGAALQGAVAGVTTALSTAGDASATASAAVATAEAAMALAATAAASPSLMFDTKAEMDAALAYPAGTQGQVLVDGSNNGLYVKEGASGSGSWDKVSDWTIPSLGSAVDLAPSMEPEVGKNKIDSDAVVFTQRYSTGSVAVIAADSLLIARTDWIKVTPGQSYIAHGAGLFNPTAPQGGYFAEYGDTAAVSNIVWGSPPVGSGKMFTVPEDGVEYVIISLATTSNATPSLRALAGTVQLEEGEVATDIVDYEERLVVPLTQLPSSVISSGEGEAAAVDDSAWLRYVRGESQPYNRDKWPVISQHMLLKDKDVCVVSTGTSITARSTEHNSDHPDAKGRPPLMHSRNLASHIWDRLSRGWEGQKYARYDDTDVVTETSGTWATSFNLAEWDDGNYRNGLTRYSSTNGAAVQFDVPAGTWAWRFVHRTDSVASTALSVAISGGNGIAQVYDDGTSSWVEANGYNFSQRESAPVSISYSIPNPDTDAFASSSVPTKSNTTYQKRINLRFINRTAVRTVTITNIDDGTRFNYWGCEWSPRQYMLTYINAARGSFNTQATSANGLPRVADNEVHGFKPDLIYGEMPIHNDGAAGVDIYATWDRWGRLANNYAWRADYDLSLKTRAAFFGYTPEFGFWTPSIAYNFGGVSADGELLSSAMTDGRVMTALDKFDQAAAWIWDNHPEAVFIHGVRRWVEAGFAIYGDLKTATQASSKTGSSMTNDGSHPNDVGSAVLAKVVCGPLDFVT